MLSYLFVDTRSLINVMLAVNPVKWIMTSKIMQHPFCYMSRQTYVEVSDTYFEGGTHEEMLRPQSKAKVVNKRQGGQGHN